MLGVGCTRCRWLRGRYRWVLRESLALRLGYLILRPVPEPVRCFLAVLQGECFHTFADLIHPDQIEDAYLLNTGDVSTGDILAPTSEISAATVSASLLRVGDIPADATMVSEIGAVIGGPLAVYGDPSSLSGIIIGTTDEYFRLYFDGDHARFVSQRDIYIDPTDSGRVTAFIVPCATIQFLDVLGDKIRFYSNSFKIAVSPFDLDIVSDRNIKFHSDTVEDLFQILGDEGHVIAKHNITAGGNIYATTSFRFVEEQPGDKIYLYYPLYKISVSPSDLDLYTDRYIKFHSDSNEDAIVLDADTGELFAGQIRVATSDGTVACEINGDCAASSFITLSVSSLKENIQDAALDDINAAVERVRQAKLRTFYWKLRKPEITNFSDVFEGIEREETSRVLVQSATDQWLQAVQEWERKKRHPKYGRQVLGFVADRPGTPERWIGHDDHGNTKGMVYSQTVPDLVAADQYVLDRLDVLEARIEALEATSP